MSRRYVFWRNTFAAISWLPVPIYFNEHLFAIFPIQGSSMRPTLNPDTNLGKRDWVFGDRRGLSSSSRSGEKELKKGDIVILK